MRPRPALILPLLVVSLLLSAGGALRLAGLQQPAALADLERLQSAGESARAQTHRIAVSLAEIVENLEPGAGLDEMSADIRALTLRQRASLLDLERQLKTQLASLRLSAGSVRAARSLTGAIARLSARQARLLLQSIEALRELNALSKRAADASLELSRYVRYGARMAEDSKRGFGGP